jgi:uncharacterized protein (TIGR03437 family)
VVQEPAFSPVDTLCGSAISQSILGMLKQAWLWLAALSAGQLLQAADTRLGAAPSYTISSIVNAADFSSRPIAPNTIVAIFGVRLARSAQAITGEDIKGGKLPVELNYVRVGAGGSPAPLFFVSDSQINFLMPPEQLPGNIHIQVITEGTYGPDIVINLVDASPALFQTADGYAIAQHGIGSALIVADSPARPGETIVLYATGLGRTQRSTIGGEIPQYQSQILRLADLKVTIGGVPLEAKRIAYAGITPGSAGLYQINLILPDTLAADPEIRVSIGDQSTPAGLKLNASPQPLQPRPLTEPQPSDPGPR